MEVDALKKLQVDTNTELHGIGKKICCMESRQDTAKNAEAVGELKQDTVKNAEALDALRNDTARAVDTLHRAVLELRKKARFRSMSDYRELKDVELEPN